MSQQDGEITQDWNLFWPLARLEIVVDPWIEGVWEALKKTVAEMATQGQQDTDSGRSLHNTDLSAASQESTGVSGLDVSLGLLKLKDSPAEASELPKSTSEVETRGTQPAPLEASLTQSLLPLSESALNVPALPPPFLRVSLEDAPAQEVVSLWVLYSVLEVHRFCLWLSYNVSSNNMRYFVKTHKKKPSCSFYCLNVLLWSIAIH